MPSKDDGTSRLVGWYVQVPRSLRDKFDEMYPFKGAHTILTTAALQHATALKPQHLEKLYELIRTGGEKR